MRHSSLVEALKRLRADVVVRALACAVGVSACSKEPLDENVRALGLAPSAMTPTGSAGSAEPSSEPGTSRGGSGTPGTTPSPDLPSAGAGGGASEPGAQEEPPVAFTKRGLREALAGCARSSYGEFADAALALQQATQGLESDPSASLEPARTAWRVAMASWQRAELFRFGPAARSPQPGALNLRDEIYAFPLANYCRVDQQLTDGSFAAGDFASSLSSARGLAALEYLLFHAGAGNACSAAIGINTSGAWTAIGADDLARRRRAYAARAAADVASRANALRDAWSPESGNFQTQFVDAGRAGSPFASEQLAFNAVSDALLYLEKEVKDWKLGWPLGLVPECLNAPSPCPTEVESRYARASTDHLRQNLIGFRRAFAGCGAGAAVLGFDDWLAASGAADLARSMLDALDAAQAEVEALNPPVEQALVTNPETVRVLHAAVKGVTDLLKTEFITVLDFELPMALEGDND